MVHQYKNNGYNIVLDVCSGSVHVVDDLVYDVIALYEQYNIEEIIAKLPRYSEEEVREACEEIAFLKENGQLFTEDVYKEAIIDFKKRKTVVKALCLHIAHDCNLACRYCFAEEGEYHGGRGLMSFDVGKKALDFLIANSGNRVNLEVDFFGGEIRQPVKADLLHSLHAEEPHVFLLFIPCRRVNTVFHSHPRQDFIHLSIVNSVTHLFYPLKYSVSASIKPIVMRAIAL